MAYQCVITYTPHEPNKLLCLFKPNWRPSGGVRFIMPNAYVHYLFIKWWRDSGAATPHSSSHLHHHPIGSHAIHARLLYLWKWLLRWVRSPRISSILRAHSPQTAHFPLGHALDCFRIIAHWFKQFDSPPPNNNLQNTISSIGITFLLFLF